MKLKLSGDWKKSKKGKKWNWFYKMHNFKAQDIINYWLQVKFKSEVNQVKKIKIEEAIKNNQNSAIKKIMDSNGKCLTFLY